VLWASSSPSSSPSSSSLSSASSHPHSSTESAIHVSSLPLDRNRTGLVETRSSQPRNHQP
jgi:hypothetical protein